MPVYEYECKECGNRFEKMQPITADPLKDCPVCGQSALRRVFHPVGVIFKGSGWYITDSRNSSKGANKASGDTASEVKTEAKSEKSDSSTTESSGASAPASSSD